MLRRARKLPQRSSVRRTARSGQRITATVFECGNGLKSRQRQRRKPPIPKNEPPNKWNYIGRNNRQYRPELNRGAPLSSRLARNLARRTDEQRHATQRASSVTATAANSESRLCPRSCCSAS